MKRLLAIGFILLFALQFAGLYGYFGVRLLAIRKEMKAQLALLPEAQLQQLIVTAKEFELIDQEEGELEWEGKMYDIAKIEKQNDHYILFVLHDELEDNLLSFLDEIVKRSGNDKKPLPVQLLQLLSMVFLPIENTFTVNQPKTTLAFPSYLNLYYSIGRAIPTPPPWCSSIV